MYSRYLELLRKAVVLLVLISHPQLAVNRHLTPDRGSGAGPAASRGSSASGATPKASLSSFTCLFLVDRLYGIERLGFSRVFSEPVERKATACGADSPGGPPSSHL